MTYTEILKHYADKGMSMTLVEALHHITEMYMEQCGISISLRTVIYEAGEYLYDELLKDDGWKEKMDNEIYLFRAMPFFHDDYTLEKYEDYDITSFSDEEREECWDIVIEENCSSIDIERQEAVPYPEQHCEEKLQAFCRGISLMLDEKRLNKAYDEAD